MPRFIFQLEGVLRQRELVEQQRQRDLAMLMADMREMEDRVRSLETNLRTSNEDVRSNRLVGTLDMSFLAAHRRFMLATQRQAMELVQKMALLQRRVDDARKAVAEAAKQRKIVEKLRDKQHARWQAELARKEQSTADEVAMQLAYWHGSAAQDNSNGEPS